MYRRTFLATVPTLALAGCLRRLGLTEHVVVTEKWIEATEIDLDDGDGEERTLTLIRRLDASDGPVFEDVHEDLEGRFGEDEALVLEDDLQRDLENEYLELRLRARVCEDAPLGEPDGARGCEVVNIVRDDFNEVYVGDVIEVRSSGDGIGLLEVYERREDRE